MAGGGYIARNFGRVGKPAPIYHFIVGTLLFGYTLEYNHISTCRLLSAARAKAPPPRGRALTDRT